MENNQKYISIKCKYRIDYENIKNYLDVKSYNIKTKDKKLKIKIPLKMGISDSLAKEIKNDLVREINNNFYINDVKFKVKCNIPKEKENVHVTMSGFTGGTGEPLKDNAGFSFHDTIAETNFENAMLRGKDPKEALLELRQQATLMSIRASIDGADEYTTDMSDYEKEDDYGL